ncbi:Vacuolar fusion protein MON1 [Tolypocladium ophioglossoides CBS 100239]|uniref:Vacuolar fusion protein MON1 n=1 Tax=Tolypocladium ophioglossoides (strain CBS 100239) TaxID=1163406 RepID=A0A0L0NMG0_TOLOC|nr:Vacuolar fusion protein MON1 [Tolypocladium ophioglossoides CBS 100239]
MGQETGSSGDEQQPPLPPRRPSATSPDSRALQAHATTAITPVDIQTLSFPDGSRGTFSTPGTRSVSTPIGSGYASPSHKASVSGGEGGDDAGSVMSFAPTMRPAGDIASLLAGELNRKSPAWNLLQSQSAAIQPFERSRRGTQDRLADFEQEFEPMPEETGKQFEDDDRLGMWKSKLKHYMILSSAGKPIWSRHGDLNLINSSIGVVQTIISFYEGSKNPLQGFTAGDARFVVSTQGPLYFVAISKLGESDSQLRSQLEALYMQILSTLTLPTLGNIFVNRPSTDLRKPLQGTESLLSSLADNFTKGSASALLGSLECLRLRKSERHTVNNTFLKLRADKLLYGLIVAGGKLVSVIRPRRHSLHPSDLQLIFNMLFESDGIKGGGGENWIPICLPAFNNKGYLYMYVSFFEGVSGEQATAPAASEGGSTEEEIAMILISPDRESFYSLKQMRDDVAQQLAKNGSLAIIRKAARAGRPTVPQVAPGSQISHFLYKSRANVQFCMASLHPAFAQLVERRRLMTLYHELHASVHAKHAHLKVLHCVSEEATSLAWITPVFEFYCVGGPNISRASTTQGANKIIQWAKKEEQRLFIIGGGVF